MLKSRIIATLKFFDLQDIPLTLFELHKYLLNDLGIISANLDESWEVSDQVRETNFSVTLGRLEQVLRDDCINEVRQFRGYYFLPHRTHDFVSLRLSNYLYAMKRERRIRRYGSGGRHIPFVRGLGLVGSQALGLYKVDSDIDVLVFTKPGYMWLARVFITLYFQFLGVRRYGQKIADRFCLNHYVAGPKALERDRNLYTASEYLKLRSLYSSDILTTFLTANFSWVRLFFPHARILSETKPLQSRVQRILEYILTNRFGQWLNQTLKRLLIGRIHQGKFVVVAEDELAFHPHNRKAELFAAFFKRQKQDHRESI